MTTITLLTAEFNPPGEWRETTAHENADDAVTHTYAVPEGAVFVTIWQGLVHEVLYQTPCETEAESAARNRKLFAHYGEGLEWTEILDNGFGKTYRRNDGERYALWSYAMDFTTFGTMAFHEVKW